MTWSHLRRWSALAGAVATLLVVAGCGGSTGSDAGASDGGEPQKGGTLTIAYQNEIQSLDPTSNTTAAGAGSLPFYALYDALFTLDPKTGEVQPKIGQSLTADESQKVWTLKILSGVKFSDGTPYDAAAVKTNWERAKAPTSAIASAASEIASMKVVDPTTLEVTLAAPNSSFDKTVAQQLLFIASPTALKNEGEGFATKPVGAGPFTLASWVRDSQKSFDANKSYYDEGKPYVDHLVIKTIPDESQAITAIKTGQADLFYTQNAGAQKELEAAGMKVTSVTTPGSPNIAFNMKKPPFDDPSMRKAFAEAIDTEQMAKVTGGTVPTTTPFGSGSPYNYDLSWPKHDKDDAQKLFDAYAAAHGGTVSFTIESFQDSANQEEAKFLQTALNQYDHVKVNVKVASASTAIGNVFSGNYEAHTWGAPWYQPSGLYIYLHSGQQLNVYGYSNPDVDKALDAARATGDEGVQEAQYKTVVQAMVEDLPFFNYGVRQASNVYTTKVHGVKLFYDAYPFVEDIWLG